MKDGTKDCEVLSSGKWPQRARAMKSEDGYLTSSGKNKCTTSHSTQLKASIEETLSWNVQTVLVRLEEQIGRCLSGDACVSARRIVVSSIPHGQRAVPSETAASLRFRCLHEFRRRGRCVYTVNADVPLDSVLVWFAVRCLSFGSVVLHWCRRHMTVESARQLAAVDLNDCATHDEHIERGHHHQELVRGLVTFEVQAGSTSD